MFLRFIWWQPSQFLVNRIVSMQTCLLIHYYQYFLLNQWHLVLFTFICHILVETAMIGKIESHRFFKHGLFLYWKTILNCCKRRLFRILDMNSCDMHFSSLFGVFFMNSECAFLNYKNGKFWRHFSWYKNVEKKDCYFSI